MDLTGERLLFSPSDPAYPPTRQTIYLQVSTPRALVVLSSAGTLHQIVQDFIANSLPEPLRLIIPALSLAPSGELTGGSPSDNGKDILASVTHLADKQTGVLLGPDSLGTLSFTSGSEGIPKGVKGRHFSLTHFFPWMSTRFGLSEKERFTMLSGIAHDPIQRDSEWFLFPCQPSSRLPSLMTPRSLSVHPALPRRRAPRPDRGRHRHPRSSC